MQSCGKCPVLGSNLEKDLSTKILNRKIRAFAPHLSNAWIITPSKWLGDLAQKSLVFQGARFRVIPNVVDLEAYHPRERMRGINMMQSNCKERVVLFVAANLGHMLKGGDLLIEAWRHLQAKGFKIRVCCVGDAKRFQAPKEWKLLSFAEDEADMAAIMASADVMVVPSEVENFPNVICEALACGVPVIASNVGGIPELVINGVTGFTLKERTAACLADTLQIFFDEFDVKSDDWRRACRNYSESHFADVDVVGKHIQLYDEALKSSDRPSL
jgi:glycosyltransferase involved in cell wall biosynthesis